MDIGYYKSLEPFWGSWRIEKEIGEGAYGKVFLVSREEFGHKYTSAMKAITIPQSESEWKSALMDGMDEESVTSMFRGYVAELVSETEMMSRFKGQSNIVSYEDHAVIEHANGRGWDILIRMELLTPLLDVLPQDRSLEREKVIKLGIDMCNAISLCERARLIHRDIKPENIFVSEMGDYKLGDFGIARKIEQTTGAQSKKGTYTYMAPEVYKEHPYGATVDIYSLGIVLYRLLNRNRAPFFPPYPETIDYRSKEQALLRRMSGEAIPLPVDARDALGMAILKACSYEPAQRFRNAAELAMALRAAEQGSAFSDVPPLPDETNGYYEQTESILRNAPIPAYPSDEVSAGEPGDTANADGYADTNAEMRMDANIDSYADINEETYTGANTAMYADTMENTVSSGSKRQKKSGSNRWIAIGGIAIALSALIMLGIALAGQKRNANGNGTQSTQTAEGTSEETVQSSAAEQGSDLEKPIAQNTATDDSTNGAGSPFALSLGVYQVENINGGDGINIRMAPDSSSQMMGQVDSGDHLNAYYAMLGDDGNLWYAISLNTEGGDHTGYGLSNGESVGYIRAEFLSIIVDEDREIRALPQEEEPTGISDSFYEVDPLTAEGGGVSRMWTNDEYSIFYGRDTSGYSGWFLYENATRGYLPYLDTGVVASVDGNMDHSTEEENIAEESDWRNEYRRIIEDFEEKTKTWGSDFYDSVEGERPKYAFAYIDDDDIPELCIEMIEAGGFYFGPGTGVYTYVNGKAEYIVSTQSDVWFIHQIAYKPRTGEFYIDLEGDIGECKLTRYQLVDGKAEIKDYYFSTSMEDYETVYLPVLNECLAQTRMEYLTYSQAIAFLEK